MSKFIFQDLFSVFFGVFFVCFICALFLNDRNVAILINRNYNDRYFLDLGRDKNLAHESG